MHKQTNIEFCACCVISASTELLVFYVVVVLKATFLFRFIFVRLMHMQCMPCPTINVHHKPMFWWNSCMYGSRWFSVWRIRQFGYFQNKVTFSFLWNLVQGKLSQFFCFTSQHISYFKCCHFSFTVASLSQLAVPLFTTPWAVKQNIMQFICSNRHSFFVVVSLVRGHA